MFLSILVVGVVSKYVTKKAKIKNRYNQVPHLIKDTTWESDKNTKKKYHIQESQEVSPFPAGNHTRVIFYVRRIGLYLYKYRIYGTISIYILKGLAFLYQLV